MQVSCVSGLVYLFLTTFVINLLLIEKYNYKVVRLAKKTNYTLNKLPSIPFQTSFLPTHLLNPPLPDWNKCSCICCAKSGDNCYSIKFKNF